jgi:phosphatidylserine decarboxylase
MRHEMSYSFGFSVVDRDSFSGNDFVASTNFPVRRLIAAAPEEDPDTGLYKLHDPPEYSPPVKESKPRFRLPLSRSSSSTSITKLGRPGLKSDASQLSLLDGQMTAMTPPMSQNDGQVTPQAPTSNLIDSNALQPIKSNLEPSNQEEDPDMLPYEIPLELKNRERWEDKHSPYLYINAKFLPYRALRQQFWRAMLKQYDIDESRRVSKIELTTMLDTLGSTLRTSTIDSFFDRFAEENGQSDNFDLTFDQAVICLEDQLEKIVQQKSLGERLLGLAKQSQTSTVDNGEDSFKNSPRPEDAYHPSANEKAGQPAVPAIEVGFLDAVEEEGSYLDEHDLGDDEGDEHVIEIRECPICHQPLKHRTDADVITHIATCASSDWRQVNNLVMGGFVTASQAQRKWYSKVMTKVSYGNYRLGANSANILVQDRLTGQINEERMSVYVRLGIRLMYKALGNREMEKKRSMYLFASPHMNIRLMLPSSQDAQVS